MIEELIRKWTKEAGSLKYIDSRRSALCFDFVKDLKSLPISKQTVDLFLFESVKNIEIKREPINSLIKGTYDQKIL